ncbi:MAG: AraC family transcriptional regulator [Rhizobacter sp.]
MTRLVHTRQAGSVLRGRMRLFEDGFLYASTTGGDSRSCRHSASLVLALTDAGLEIEVGGQTQHVHAVAVRPSTPKRMRACGIPYVCIDASTNHPLYRAFATLGDPGLQVLPREHFAPALSSLAAFTAGETSPRTSRLLYNRVFDLLRELMPDPAPVDPRITRVIARLDEDPSLGVAQLATEVCVSRDRLSHLFTQEMGLPLRKYAQSLKIRAAARFFGKGLSLTQIAAAAGFSDSAHFSKIWAQAYGMSPAFYFTSGQVAVYPPANRPEGNVAGALSSRFRSRNAANNQDRMPTTKV